jgi:putative membrane protein
LALVDLLPEVNASLNALAATLLVVGRAAIKRGRLALHKRCMIAALVASSLFLAGYLTRRALGGHTPFQGKGASLAIYVAILLSHTVLAVTVVPLALTTLVLALRGRFERHRRLARITWPIWLYVSVTGVIVWWMLYSGTFGPRPGGGA